MRKLYTFILMITVSAIGIAQTYVTDRFSIDNSRFDIYQNIEADSHINGNSLKGTGIDNAVEFNDWSEMLIVLVPDLAPNGWIMQTGNPAAHQSTDAYIGTYAMHIETGVIGESLSAGFAIPGKLSFSFTTFSVVSTQGEAYTERPISMSFALKGTLLNNDTAVVVFQSTKDGALVGAGGYLLGPEDMSNDEYNVYEASISYQNALTPDTVMIIATSGAVGVFSDGDIGTLTEGSFIMLDNIILNFESTNIVTGEKGSLEIFPNPANETITISGIGLFDVTIFNSIGEIVYNNRNIDQNISVDIRNFAPGNYIVNTGDEQIKFTIIK
ncbi:MAG TPA: T9SS type A sorting domain-containing protein [Bacteroidales bacterium]|nr:T9SS type A sorting domain-containing protein [Bacteroidales bacterium]